MIKGIKSHSELNETQQESNNGNILNYEDEIKLNLNRTNIIQFAYPFHQITMSMYQYEFVKSYLFGIYQNVLSDNKIKIISYLTTYSSSNPATCSPNISSSNAQGLAIIENQVVYADLLFEGSRYQVSIFLKVLENGGSNLIKHFIAVLGIECNSVHPTKVIDYIVDHAIKNSIYKNKIIKIKNVENTTDIVGMGIKEFENEHLDDIFIPQMFKDELYRFYECVDQYEKIGMGLRFLFSGEPGTGKTKTIRALINKCFGKATIIISEGDVDFSELFRFAELFEPAILIIDDLDLKLAERNMFNNSNLGSFLQELDGFRKNNVFVLATTNSKELLDKAASRAGRFDLLVDFSKLKKENYFDIIRSNCQDKRILDIFDDKILNYLKNKKLTGAFLTNLLKQLKTKIAIDTDVDLKEYLNRLIELSYKGFYKKSEEKEHDFGFSSHIDKNGIEAIHL